MTPRPIDESGSALVIALIFVGVWSIAIVAVLSFVETGFKLASASAAQRDITYAADGGADQAIGFLVHRGAAGSCPDYLYQVEDGSPLQATVDCDSGPLEAGVPQVVDIAVDVTGSRRLEVRVELDFPGDPNEPDDPANLLPASDARVTVWNHPDR